MVAGAGLESAAELVAKGRPKEALAVLDGLEQQGPALPSAWILRARALVQLGDGDGAHRALVTARQQHPDDADVLVELGRLYVKANAPQPAADTFSALARQFPDDIRAQEGLADILLAAGDTTRAIPFLKQIIEQRPDDHLRARQLGHALILSGEYYAAAKQLQPLIDVFPDHGKTALLCGDAYYNCELVEDAISCFERVEVGPHLDAARSALVGCLVREGKLEEAIARAEAEIQRGSTRTSDLYVHQSAAFTFLNNKSEALATCKAALEINPRDASAWFAKVDLSSEDCSDDDVAKMASITETGSPPDRARASFALAKLHADRRDIPGEMNWLEKGNSIVASLRPYSEDAMERFFEGIKAQFPPLQSPPAKDADSDFRPVFVLGLPRSGTTLTEQILSAHGDIDGSGESLAFHHAAGGQGIESRLQQMDGSWMSAFAVQYARYQRAAGFHRRWVTDKGISLYFFVGMLQRAFPQASFVALQRHPMDLALGVWRKHFLTGHAYIYEPRRFAHAVSLYRRVIDYWADQDGINLIRLDYESLVADPQGWARRLADHVGAPFDEQMLRPQGNNRQVLTASTTQIREGINQKAVGRWQAYADQLQDFVQAYAHYGVHCPD